PGCGDLGDSSRESRNISPIALNEELKSLGPCRKLTTADPFRIEVVQHEVDGLFNKSFDPLVLDVVEISEVPITKSNHYITEFYDLLNPGFRLLCDVLPAGIFRIVLQPINHRHLGIRKIINILPC